MKDALTAFVQVDINASLSKVWDALVNPEVIKQYLFGTEVITDWKVGSPIVYKGEWKGTQYEDKGKVLEIIPEELLVTTFWSSMSRTEDTPDNYNTITYKLSFKDGVTHLELSQDNNKTEEDKIHSEENWQMVLKSLKEILEK